MSWITWTIFGISILAFLGWNFFRQQLNKEDIASIRQALHKGALLLDVRTPAEYKAGHIDGALNIPLGELQKRLKEVGRKKAPVVVYCRSGNRSATATQILKQAGFQEVYDMKAKSNWKSVQSNQPATGAVGL